METNHDLATDTENASEDRFADMRASKPWLEAIKDSQKYYQTYNDKCDKIDKLYADLEALSGSSNEREFQIFWANLEVLKPSIYSRAPVPVVGARFKDRKPLVRHSSEMLERALRTSFDLEDIHVTMKQVRDDLATNARGVPWCRYENDGETERVAYDHVDRRDFVMQQARKWKEVGWVARRVFLSREEMKIRFEESNPNYHKATFEEKKDDSPEDYAGEKKAAVWELWSREKHLVVWVTEQVDDVLDIAEPHLNLEGFYPCPRPAYGTVERHTLKPVPDFLYYKDQVEEINELTARISALSEALRMKGFYAGGAEDIAEAIETAIKQQDNNAVLIPVPNFAALGGAKLSDAIVWLPVEQVAQTVQNLVALRKQLIDDVYEITGLSDIMRGNTDAAETLGAQQLKSQYGATRIKDRQEELIRIARDLARIAGEIMAENFAPKTIIDMSQYDEIGPQFAIDQQVKQIMEQAQQAAAQVAQAAQDPVMVQKAQENPEEAEQLLQQVEQQKQQAEQKIKELQEECTYEKVFEFLRDERMRPFVLEIETDSTVQPDEDAQKQRATEFVGALGQALGQLAPMVQQNPQTAEFAGEVLKFAVAPFRAGRSLEAAVDSFVDNMKEQASQPQPDPEAQKLQAEQAMKQAELQMKQSELQMKQADMQAKGQAEQAKAMAVSEQAQVDVQKTFVEIEKLKAEIAKITADTDARIVDAQSKREQPQTETVQ